LNGKFELNLFETVTFARNNFVNRGIIFVKQKIILLKGNLKIESHE